MANVIDRFMDLMKLSFDDEYDDEDDAAEKKEAKEAAKKKREEEKAENQRMKEARKAQAREKDVKKEQQRVPNSFTPSKVEKTAVRRNSNVSVVRGGNSSMESEIVSIRPTDDNARQEIGNYLLQGKTVVINLDGLDLDVAQRIVDFTFGVCYAIKGDMKFPSKYIVIAVPDEVGLSGFFENSGDGTGNRTAARFNFDK